MRTRCQRSRLISLCARSADLGSRTAPGSHAPAHPGTRPGGHPDLRGSRPARPRSRRSDRTSRAPREALCDSPVSDGGTRMTRSPAASSARSNRADTCRQSSTAHTRSRSSAAANRKRPGRHRRWRRSFAAHDWHPSWHPERRACACACARPPQSRSSIAAPSLNITRRSTRRTPLSRGAATLLSSHAGGPRSATGDTAKAGQTQGSTVAKRVSPPPPETQPDRPDVTDPSNRLSLSGNAIAEPTVTGAIE